VPAVIVNPPRDAKVSTLEVFGPVTCVYPFTRLGDAISAANSLPMADRYVSNLQWQTIRGCEGSGHRERSVSDSVSVRTPLSTLNSHWGTPSRFDIQVRKIVEEWTGPK